MILSKKTPINSSKLENIALTTLINPVDIQ